VCKLQPVDVAGRIPQVRDGRSLKYHKCHEAKDIDSLQCRPRGHRGQPALFWWITLLCRCCDQVWGPDIYSRFCISRHVYSKTGSTVPSLCYARTSPLLDWGTGIIVQIVTMLPTAETAHNNFVADVPHLVTWKSNANLRFTVGMSLSKKQFFVTHTIRHTY
jgi:hypothetical protein